MSRQRMIWIGLAILAIPALVALSYLLSVLFDKSFVFNVAIATQIASVIFSGLISVVGILLGWSVNRQKTLAERDLKMRFHLSDNSSQQLNELNKEQKENQEELFDITKQQLDLSKEQLELEQKKQTIVWQKEALALINVSPQAAILIAGLGVEQELQRVAKLLGSPDERQRSVFSHRFLTDLKKSEHIDDDTILILKDMRQLRNKVVHGLMKEGDVSPKTALDYVLQAIHISEKFSAIQAQIPYHVINLLQQFLNMFLGKVRSPEKLTDLIGVTG